MNSKKAPLIIFLVLALGAAAMALVMSRSGSAPSLPAGGTKLTSTLPAPLQLIRKDSVLAFYLNRDEWQVLADSLRALSPQLEKLAVWKKLELPSLAAELERSLTESSQNIEPWITEAWQQLEAILFLVGPGRIEITEKIAVPPVLLQVQFRTEEAPVKALARITEELKKHPTEEVVIEENPNMTALTVQDKEKNISVRATLDVAEKNLRLRLGAIDPASFFSATPAEALPSSMLAQYATQDLPGSPAFFAFVSYARLADWLRSVAKDFPEAEGALAGLTTIDPFRESVLWGSFRQGFQSRACVLMDAQNPLTQKLRDLYSADDGAASTGLWQQFVAAETIFFMEYAPAQLWAQFEIMMTQLDTMSKLAPNGTPMPDEGKVFVEKARSVLQEARTFPLQKLGVVVERNPSTYIPRGALVLESSSTAAALADKLGALIERNAPPDSGVTVQRENGGLTVHADPLTISAVPLDDKKLAIAMQPGDLEFIRSRTKPPAPTPFLNALARELQKKSYDIIVLVHTSPLLDLARPFLTMGASAAGHGIEPQDLDEAGRFLEGFLTITSKTAFTGQDAFCTAQGAKVVSKREFEGGQSDPAAAK